MNDGRVMFTRWDYGVDKGALVPVVRATVIPIPGIMQAVFRHVGDQLFLHAHHASWE
jgi:hypothetical protein